MERGERRPGEIVRPPSFNEPAQHTLVPVTPAIKAGHARSTNLSSTRFSPELSKLMSSLSSSVDFTVP
jgi:hypothetical protein